MTKQIKPPAESYLKKNVETVAVTVRIAKSTLDKIELFIEKYDTSKNHFFDAAATWYIKELD